MDAITEQPQAAQDEAAASAFVFEGDWREFAPIAFTNLLLSIVTLGIYRFWAVTREREYLWGRTRLIDAPLEWTGRGMELFIGFLMTIFLLGLPYLLISLIAQGALLQGEPTLTVGITAVSAVVIFYLIGVARFRALRYRLSRTHWYGIRGGSDNPGFTYGWSYMWKSAVGTLAAGLMVPWSMCSLWDERWSKMSFGPHHFESHTEAGPLMKRFLLFYLLPVLGIIMGAVAGFAAAAGGFEEMGGAAGIAAVMIVGVLIVGAIYIGLPIIWLIFYSKFYRNAMAGLSLDTLEFAFTARTKDWFILILFDIIIVIGTLGVGMIFLGYRHWKFFVTHMEVYGEIDLDRLTQSTTASAAQGEGLLDALDVGAF